MHPSKAKPQAQVSQEELQNAIHKFLKSGGIIQRLPPQKSISYNQIVGKKWWNGEPAVSSFS